MANAGIAFKSINDEGSLDVRYDRLRGEITSLPPDKFIIYEYFVERGWDEKKLKDKESEMLSKENDEKNKEREQLLELKLK